MTVDLRSSSRVNPETGVREQLEFFGDPGARLFGVRYHPSGRPLGGVVLCPSLHGEMVDAYRNEVLVARALAAAGVAVQRFHYRGTGHSEGDVSTADFGTLVSDARRAMDRLISETGEGAPMMMGTRLGGIVAAACASGNAGSPLVLWEPVMRADRFFREAVRAAKISAVKETKNPRRVDGLLDELRRAGSIEVLGYPIDLALYDSLAGRSLSSELGDAPRSILVLQIGRARKPRSEYEEAVRLWTERGFEVEIRLIAREEISWFLPGARGRQDASGPLVDQTVGWVVRQLKNGKER